MCFEHGSHLVRRGLVYLVGIHHRLFRPGVLVMAQCVELVEGAVVQSTSDPCLGFVLLNPVEFATLTSNPLLLTPADGFVLSAAVIGVWASAVAIRALIRALNVADAESSSD